jgi:hypothetical protein
MGYKGGDRSEFGIIDNLDYEKDYSKTYQPEKYGCIAVCSDALSDWYPLLTDMPSFYHTYSRPEFNFALYGVTLIPPSSLDLLTDVMKSKTRDEFMADTLDIIELLEKAKSEDKFVIIYGV